MSLSSLQPRKANCPTMAEAAFRYSSRSAVIGGTLAALSAGIRLARKDTSETPARARHALRTPTKPPSTVARPPSPVPHGHVAPDAARQRVTVGVSPEILRQVKLIELRTRGLVNSLFSGEYRSVFKGQGMEFAEVREYLPGDEVRSIDWNVTARMRRPFVKRYIEERELTVMLLVDLSGSGQFGSVTRFKSEIATELCAVLALSAIRNNDKVGLILFTDRVEHLISPQKGRNRALQVIREMLVFAPAGRGTDIGHALEYLHKVCRRRAVVFLISDFLARDYEGPLRLVHQRHDLVPICITDPREMALPDLGLIMLRDLETGEHALIDSGSAAVRRAYREQREAAAAARQRLFRSIGVDLIEVDTRESYMRPLMRFFRLREKRRREGR